MKTPVNMLPLTEDTMTFSQPAKQSCSYLHLTMTLYCTYQPHVAALHRSSDGFIFDIQESASVPVLAQHVESVQYPSQHTAVKTFE